MKGQQYEGLEDVHPLVRDLIEEACAAGAYRTAIRRKPAQRTKAFGALADGRSAKVTALALQIGLRATVEREASRAAPITLDFRLRSQ